MNMTKLLYLSFLVLSLRGYFVSGFGILQPPSLVRIQPGTSTTFQCHVYAEGRFLFFWIKVPPSGASVHIANINSLRGGVEMFGQFKNTHRIKIMLEKNNFSLIFLSTEPTDIATYVCGAYGYDKIYIGNGSKLIFEDAAATKPTMATENEEERNSFDYAVPVLSATNVASIFIIIALIYHLLRKNKSGATRPDRGTGEYNTDDVSYAALTFSHRQKNTVQRRTSVDNMVIYGDVQHQEGVIVN